METHEFSWLDSITPKPLRPIVRGHVAAESLLLVALTSYQQGNIAAGLQHLIKIHPAAARAFAFDVAASAPAVAMNISPSRGHCGGRAHVDKRPCLTRSSCTSGGYWLVNLNRRLLVEELEALQGVPLVRFGWPAGATRAKYSGMIGNGFTVGVIGRVALQPLKTIGKLPASWPDTWADESRAWAAG